MAIKFEDATHVLRRFCELGGDHDQTVNTERSKLALQINELHNYGKMQNDPTRSHGEKMEIYQDILRIRSLCNDLRATIRRLEAMPVVIHDKTHVERRTEEFRRICALRRVLYAAVDSHNAISIVVNATYVYKGIPYDLGDWTIRFGALPPDLPFEVLKYRRNVRPGQERIYPDYIMNGDQFCLGPSNRPLIEKHFENERYLQAITVIIGVVNSVNADDVDMVPKVFFPKIPTTIGAITWPLFTNGPMTYT